MSNSDLTIIIPAKNEAANIVKLLKSIAAQSYLKIHKVPVIIADADSSDDTRVAAFMVGVECGLPSITIIPGGLPAVGRNAGAQLAKTKYLLFLDADVELEDSEFVSRVLEEMDAKNLHSATTDIHCPDGGRKSKLAYSVNNFFQRGSRFFGTPFSTGMCMFFNRAVFLSLDGFREDALFAEDYMLSKQVGWRRFRVIPGGVRTSDRRFQKMGLWKLAKLFFSTALFSHRESQFTKDHGYWDA